MIQLRKSQAGNRIVHIMPVALMLLIAACGPTGNDGDNAELPTLAEQSQSVAQAPTDGLLPTLVPYPTLPPSPTPTATQPLEPEIVQPEVTEAAAASNDPFSGGGIEFQPEEAPPRSEAEGTDSETANLDLPPGVNPEDVVTGGGGTLESDGEQGPPGFDTDSAAEGDSNDLFSGGGISFDGPPGVDLNATTSTGTFDNSSGDMPFDPNAASSDDPFSSINASFGASSTHIIGGEQPVSVFECPQTTCDVIGTMEAGDPVVIVEESGEWIGVEFQGSTGYVFGNFIAERQREQTAVGDGSDFPAGFENDEFGNGPMDANSGLPFDPNAASSDDPFGTGTGTFANSGSSTGARYAEGSGFSTGSGFGTSNLNPLFNVTTTTTDNSFGGENPPFNTGTNNQTGGVPGIDCPPFLDTCS